LLKFARGSAGKTAYFQKNQSTAEAAQSFAAAIRQFFDADSRVLVFHPIEFKQILI
jgi:hypothetical protein